MSSKNMDANPDYFKVAGRERPGKATVPEINKQQFAKTQESAHPATKPKSKRRTTKP